MTDYFPYGEFNQAVEPDSWSVEELLNQSSEIEEQRLEDALGHVEQELEERDRLHRETVEELESKLDRYVKKFDELYEGIGRVPQEEKNRLKNRITEFYRRIREENRRHWTDRQELERERREILRELSEVDDEDWLVDFLNGV